VSAVIALVCGALALLLAQTSWTAAQVLLEYQAAVNMLIVAFNMLPAFPLDGGRVARASLWARKGDKLAATVAAAAIGRAFAYVFVALGVFALVLGVPSGFWFALIGLFLLLASRAEVEQTRLQGILAGRRAGQLVPHPAVVLPGDLSVAEAIRDFFVPLGYTAFPVADLAGRPIGLLSLGKVRGVAPSARSKVLVADVADRDPDLFVDADQDVSEMLGRPAFMRMGRAIVVGPAGEPRGCSRSPTSSGWCAPRRSRASPTGPGPPGAPRG
jgi:hypothetical protein